MKVAQVFVVMIEWFFQLTAKHTYFDSNKQNQTFRPNHSYISYIAQVKTWNI